MKMLSLGIGAALWLLCLTILPGEAWAQSDPKPRIPASVPEAKRTKPRIHVLSDDTLQRAIARRFAQSKIGANGFSVTVRGGIATLNGVAQVSQHKGVATRLAKAAGAREVINQIEISPEARNKARAKARHKPKHPSSGAIPAQPSGGRSASDRRPANGQRQPPSEAARLPSSATASARSESGQEAEALDRPEASKSVGASKRFRILRDEPGREGGSATQPRGELLRRRRY